MPRIILAFGLTIALFGNLTAQTSMNGLVKDPQGAPVQGVRVSCGREVVVTDEAGAFALPGSGPCKARIAARDFADTTVDLVSNAANNINLTLAAMSERVIVSASGEAVTLEEAGVSATAITERDMRVRQYAPVPDLLRDVAGLNVVQTGSNGGTTSVFARGGGSNAALVVLDGIPQTDPGGALNYANLTAPGLEKLEVVRGPESALFGAEAASGVIQMFSKQGDPESTKPHGQLSYERGSFSADHWTALINGGLGGKFDYALTADQNRSTGQFLNNIFRLTTGTANVGYRLSRATALRGIVRSFDSITGTPGATFYKAFDLDGRQAYRDSSVSIRLDDVRGTRFSQRAYFTFHRQRSPFSNATGEAYTIAALLRTGPPIRPGTPSVVFVDQIVPAGTPGSVQRNVSLFAGDSLSYTSRMGGNYQATLRHQGGSFVFGYELERQSGEFSGKEVSRRNNGVTVYDQIALGSRVFISGGMRIEHSTVYGARVAPRAAVTFLLPTRSYLRFSAGRGIKEPSLLETNSPNAGFPGNPNLKPEKTTSFEVGLTRQWFGGRVRTDAAYFRNRYSDLIQFQFTDLVAFIGTWSNLDRSWARGLEVENSARLYKYISVNGNYTLLFSRVDSGADSGQELIRRPRHSGSVSLQIAPAQWSFLIGSRFVGERRDSFDTFGANRIRGYKNVYLSASYQITKMFTPYIRFNNLTNETYLEVNGYQQWGRNALAGLRLNW